MERSKSAVLAETYRQLTELGMSGVSIDEISKNSGVAKTTIYRHWPSRSALLIDACSRMGASAPAPDTGALEGDLGLLAAAVAEQLRTQAWTSVLPSIIDAAERDADIAQMQAKLHEGNMAPFSIAIERARRRGEIGAEPSTSDLISAIVGPLFYRRWFSKEDVTDVFARALVDRAVADAKAKTAGDAAHEERALRHAPSKRTRTKPA